MKTRVFQYVTAFVLLLVLLPGFVMLTGWRINGPSKMEFRLHRAHYEALVQQVKAAHLSPGVYFLSWRDDRLLPLPPDKATMEGNVTVEYTEARSYQITLITCDAGHAGAYGYVYSDTPLYRHTEDPYRNFDTLGQLVFLQDQVAPHWYRAYNDLF